MVYFLFSKWKVRPNYLIILQCFTISLAGIHIPKKIFLFLMAKLLPELQEKNYASRSSLQKYLGRVQTVLFHLHFFLPSCCFFAKKETLAKHFLTELYKNLTVEALSSDNSENLQFDALKDLCVEIGVRQKIQFLQIMKGQGST